MTKTRQELLDATVDAAIVYEDAMYALAHAHREVVEAQATANDLLLALKKAKDAYHEDLDKDK